MSFKSASRLEQARLRRPVGDYLPSYYESLTDEQKRDCLKQIFYRLEEEVLVEQDRYRKKAIGLVKFEIQQMMHEIRPRRKAPGVERHFIDAAREIVTKAMFDIIMGRAVELMNKREAKP